MVPVCRVHHRELRRYGTKLHWGADANVHPPPIALKLWRRLRSAEFEEARQAGPRRGAAEKAGYRQDSFGVTGSINPATRSISCRYELAYRKKSGFRLDGMDDSLIAEWRATVRKTDRSLKCTAGLTLNSTVVPGATTRGVVAPAERWYRVSVKRFLLGKLNQRS
jgi:hypothetical protein